MSDQPISAAEISIHVNGQAKSVVADMTLGGLLHEMGIGARKGIAAAVNDAVVPRAEWTLRRLTTGDRVILIQATQGG